MNLKPRILRYWLAMNATAFDAAIHALVLFCGVAGAHEATQWVPALNLQQLGWVFLIAFGRALLAYVEAHPVADVLAEVGRVPPPGALGFAGPPCEGTRPTSAGNAAEAPREGTRPTNAGDTADPPRGGTRPTNAGDTGGSLVPPQAAIANPQS